MALSWIPNAISLMRIMLIAPIIILFVLGGVFGNEASTGPGGSEARFRSGVAAPDHYDIVCIGHWLIIDHLGWRILALYLSRAYGQDGSPSRFHITNMVRTSLSS